MRTETRNIVTAIVANLTDIELHADAAAARVALWQSQDATTTELFSTIVEIVDAEIIRRARVALAAFDAAAA